MSATYLEVSNSRENERNVSFMRPLSSAVAISIDPMIEDDLDDVIVEEIPKIKIGICAMNKKTKSQPMQEILSRIASFDFVEIIVFSDDVIMKEPVEDWPLCDALISFYSTGFPLSKAIKYAELRQPFVLNDLEMQFTLLDRCAVYRLLESANIEMPRYAILMRDNNGAPINTDFVELEDSIQIGNIVFQKPFVEKPVNAEDHNVFIYFPSSAGGGSQRLFRKVGSRSSVYSAESSVRKFGSYIYEDFVHTDGTDVKIYTVGPEYAHAEARKSPSLDGKVERDSQGKEIRYPVILNSYEKEIAHKVCKLFKQTVCGFDLLRTHGKSYVCDVNGFSFVKTSMKYYDDCAQVLVNCILQQLAPQLYKPYNIELDNEDHGALTETLDGTVLELRCVVGVIRHGDRTPKQKMKMEVRHPRFLELFKKYNKSTDKKLKLKRPNQLQEVLDIARYLLEELEAGSEMTMFEKPNKLQQLKNVLEMYGHFSGINRKIQLKYLGKIRDSSESSGGENSEAEKTLKVKEKDNKEDEALLLIMKWGGELTQAGRVQAEELGKAFRCMYPGGDGAYSSLPGCGLLRLHSTYRHDLKIYASDEGRVQMTAAAFAKGFLALEGELTPILVHLVRSDKSTTEMLDTSDQATKFMAKVKHKLHDIMRIDRDFTDEDIQKLVPTKASSLVNAIKKVKNPRQTCAKLSGLVHSLTVQLKDMISNNVYKPQDPFLYHDETLELMTHRWHKLDKDFKLKNGTYDISLIPDIYDSIKYDIQHNSQLALHSTQELYNCAKALADIVIPQEYGITSDEKVKISQTICQRLLRKIQGDLKHADVTDTTTRLNPKYSQSVISPHRHVRTRLYFTSESHVHSVVNSIRYGNLIDVDKDDVQWKRALEFLGEIPELNYMTQLVLMLYEDPAAEVGSENRFHIELHFSPGTYTLDEKKSYQSRGRSAELKPCRPFTENVQDNTVASATHDGQTDTSCATASASHDGQTDTSCTTASASHDGQTDTSCTTASGSLDGQKDTSCTPVEDKGTNKLTGDKEQPEVEETVKSTCISSVQKEEESMEKQEDTNIKESNDSKVDLSTPLETQEKPYESSLYPTDDKTYYDVVDTDNERSRCAIGMEEFTDPSASPVHTDIPQEVPRSDEKGQEEDQVEVQQTSDAPKIRRHSGILAEVFVSHREVYSRTSSESDAVPFRTIEKQQTRQTLSESNIYKKRTSQSKDSQSEDDATYHQEGDVIQKESQSEAQPVLVRARSQSTSCIEGNPDYSNGREERSASDSGTSNECQQIKTSQRTEALDLQFTIVDSSPTSVRSDSVVLDERRRQTSKPLRVIHSSPTMKKSPVRRHRVSTGTMFYLPSIRAVTKKLSIVKHGPCRVRPLALSTTDLKRPPLAEFYDEILSPVASIYPLLTLHNSIPLTIMDSFLDKMTEERSGESDVSSASTPATTPTRKQPSKKLSLKSSTHQQVLDNNDSIISLEGLDLNEFKS